MTDDASKSTSVGRLELVLAIVSVLIGAYAVLTTNLLLGTIAVAFIVLAYLVGRLLVEFTRLFRRLVVAIEQIAENT